MPDDRAVFEKCAIDHPTAQACLVRPVWRCLEETTGGAERAKLMSMGLRHACRSTECLGKRLLFLLDNMALVLGALKGRGSTPNLNHTCREVCVISLATFTIPVCRWIASESNPATSHLVQSVTVQERTLMLTSVGRLYRSQPLTRSCRSRASFR